MSTLTVGQVIDYAEIRSAPAGTKLYDTKTGLIEVKTAPTDTYVFASGEPVHSEYVVLEVGLEKNPLTELATELKNAWFDNIDDNPWLRVAEYAQARYGQPQEIVDGEGDTWHLQPNGKYIASSIGITEPESIHEIAANYGGYSIVIN